MVYLADDSFWLIPFLCRQLKMSLVIEATKGYFIGLICRDFMLRTYHSFFLWFSCFLILFLALNWVIDWFFLFLIYTYIRLMLFLLTKKMCNCGLILISMRQTLLCDFFMTFNKVFPHLKQLYIIFIMSFKKNNSINHIHKRI